MRSINRRSDSNLKFLVSQSGSTDGVGSRVITAPMAALACSLLVLGIGCKDGSFGRRLWG